MLLKYVWLVLRHKWFVFLACRKVGGIPARRAIVHDWTKFLPVELWGYARWFMDMGPKDPAAFQRAWTHHYNHNPHHPEYWVRRPVLDADDPALEMPATYAREMVADWLGAGRGYEGTWDIRSWVASNLPGKPLHPHTRKYVEQILKDLGQL